jgi:putative membrane protein
MHVLTLPLAWLVPPEAVLAHTVSGAVPPAPWAAPMRAPGADRTLAFAGSDVVIAGLIVAAGLAYALGARRLALRRERGAPARTDNAPRTRRDEPRASLRRGARDTAWFAGGLAVLAGTLLGPLDAWSARSFAAHMLQHELLMLVAAPMLVLGRPLGRFAWLWPRLSRRGLRRGLARTRGLIGWNLFTSPAGACAIQAVALFAWHVPAWFRAATTNDGLHILQHAAFLAAALCFWWTVLRPGPPRRVAPPALAALFVTTLTTGALGALLTFTTRIWYAVPGFDPPWGMSLVDDQQLGGLLMWVPGGLVYLAVAVLVGARMLVPARAASLEVARPHATADRGAPS